MPGAVAITVGAFDGVHLGHQSLLRAAREAAGGGGRVTAVTFEPHPLRRLRPAEAPPRLCSLEQRRQWLAEAGADEVVVLEPTPELLGLSPEAFIEWIVAEHGGSVFVEGPDFRFGRGRGGTVETLRRLGRRLGYRTVVVEEVLAALADQCQVRVTSSLIRWLVGHGRVRDAGVLLGRPYELRGEVVRGEGRGGRALGVPTANLDAGEALLPADGIYTGAGSGPDGGVYPAAISVGTKPTFGAHPRVCEAHLLDFERRREPAYGWAMRLEFHDWLRDQVTCPSAEALVGQIRRDIARVRDAAVRGRPATAVAGPACR